MMLWLAIIVLLVLQTLAPVVEPRAFAAISSLDGISEWNKRLGKLRAEALEELFPGVLAYAKMLDPFSTGYVDYRDPLETISWITLYLPGVVFMTGVIFFFIPHILNFLIYLPKMWFFGIPCLYHYKNSIVRRKRRSNSRQNSRVSDGDGDGVRGECDSGDLTYITKQVYKSLLKMASFES